MSLEEAGEKWRAGDALKSTRFFLRAIEMYRDGLNKFPTSFDLAYNRYVRNPQGPWNLLNLKLPSARLQYEMTQQPRLLVHLEKPVVELLQMALESHKCALELDRDNADALLWVAKQLWKHHACVNVYEAIPLRF